ncbi:hypothetical protein IAU59_001771 [Kwoniella sp. CBS 9459]
MSLVYRKAVDADPSIIENGGQRDVEIDAYFDQLEMYDQLSQEAKQDELVLDALARQMCRGRFDLGAVNVSPSEAVIRAADDESKSKQMLQELVAKHVILLTAANGVDCETGEAFDATSCTAEQLDKYTKSLSTLEACMTPYVGESSKWARRNSPQLTRPLSKGAGTRSTTAANNGGHERVNEGLTPESKSVIFDCMDVLDSLDGRATRTSAWCEQDADIDRLNRAKLKFGELTSYIRAHRAILQSVSNISQDLVTRSTEVSKIKRKMKMKKQRLTDEQNEAIKTWQNSYASFKMALDRVSTVLQNVEPTPTSEEQRQITDTSKRLDKFLKENPQSAARAKCLHALSLIDMETEDQGGDGPPNSRQMRLATSLRDLAHLRDQYFAVPDPLDDVVYDESKEEFESHKPFPTIDLRKTRPESVQLLSEMDRATEISWRLYSDWRDEQIDSLRRADKDSAGKISELVGLSHPAARALPVLPTSDEFDVRLQSATDLTRAQIDYAKQLHATATTKLTRCRGYSEMYDDFCRTSRKAIADRKDTFQSLMTEHSGNDEAQAALSALLAKTDMNDCEVQQIMLDHDRAQQAWEAGFAGKTMEEYQPTLKSQIDRQLELDSLRKDAEDRLKTSRMNVSDTDFTAITTLLGDEKIRNTRYRRSESASQTSDDSSIRLTPASSSTGSDPVLLL